MKKVQVHITGDIATNKIISVETDELIDLYDTDRNKVIATVTLGETEFSSADLREAGTTGMFTEHLINAELTPGVWTGTQEFRINLKNAEQTTPVIPVEKIEFFIENNKYEAEKDQTLAEWITLNSEYGYKLEDQVGDTAYVVDTNGNPLVKDSSYNFVHGNEVIDNGESFRETFEFELEISGEYYEDVNGLYYAVGGMTLAEWEDTVLSRGIWVPDGEYDTDYIVAGSVWDKNGNDLGYFDTNTEVQIHEGDYICINVTHVAMYEHMVIHFENYSGYAPGTDSMYSFDTLDGDIIFSSSVPASVLISNAEDCNIEIMYDADTGRDILMNNYGVYVTAEAPIITSNAYSAITDADALVNNDLNWFSLYYVIEVEVNVSGSIEYWYLPDGTTYGEFADAFNNGWSSLDMSKILGHENDIVPSHEIFIANFN